MVILYGVSGIVCLLGLLLLIRAAKGRRVSSNPHCAHCGFDLLGLTLDRDAQCPECGRPTIPGTPAVCDGLFKRRPVLAMAALLLIAVGVTGFAWPKVSQIPSIKNFDWYAYFPESLLLKLEAEGNTDALQALHDRLIPGTLSDEGLETLIERSLAVLEDESVVWNERWGDVLLYGMLEGKMSDAQLKHYMEGAFELSVTAPEQIGPDVGVIQYMQRHEVITRGQGDFVFRVTCAQESGSDGIDHSENRSPYQYSIKSFLPRIAGEPIPVSRRSFSESGMIGQEVYPAGWLPYWGSSSGSGSTFRIEPGKDSYEYVFEALVEIQRDQVPFHQWTLSQTMTIKRVEVPEYALSLQDPEFLDRISSNLFVEAVSIPINPTAAMEHGSIAQSHESLMYIESRVVEEVGLLGTLHVVLGDEELPFIDLNMSRLSLSQRMLNLMRSSNREPSWLVYFIEHQAFWDRARAKGTVDLIYRPDPSKGVMGAKVDHIINVPIRWSNVPVVDLEAVQEKVRELDGSTSNRWMLREAPDKDTGRRRNTKRTHIPGEMLYEADE